METRALAIAFFLAIGTAVGGITGPQPFGKLIATGHEGQVAIGFLIGAAVMTLGGAGLLFGVEAEGEQLEDIAEPSTAEDAEQDRPAGADAMGHDEEPELGAPRGRPPRQRREDSPLRLGPGRMPTSRAPALRDCRLNQASTTRSRPSSALWTNTAPPNAGSWPGWWAPAAGVRAFSAALREGDRHARRPAARAHHFRTG